MSVCNQVGAVELTPEQELLLTRAAKDRGISPKELLSQLLQEGIVKIETDLGSAGKKDAVQNF